MSPLATTPLIDDLLAANAPVALGVSGGKDSVVMADVVQAALRERGYAGELLLVHSDLGRIEWKDSLPTCERLADALGLELLVVRRQAGDMVDRWLTRWANNVARYANLACVKLILPWSTPAMRFCTSELKTAIICRALIGRWPGQTIVSATGVRRDESSARAKSPITKPQPRLTSVTHQTTGHDWHPILEMTKAEVFTHIAARSLPLHEAYTTYGSSRVSCAFCIMSSAADLLASSSCPANQEVYRELVDLEIASTFGFQSGGWLGDVAPGYLTLQQHLALADAKRRANQRERAEARIPHHLLYTKGWPTCMPTTAEARLLASVRREVAELMRFTIAYTDADSILERYATLMADRPTTVLAPPRQLIMEIAA